MSRPETGTGTPTGTPPDAPAVPPLGGLGLARWIWRQLTSMRVALLLLLLLTIAAVPGSVFPQTGKDAAAVAAYLREHTTTGPWLQRLGFFDVYAAPWFAAIYLLLFVSLVGCIVPRARQHWRAVRARPPSAPRRLDRLAAHLRREVDADPQAVLRAAQAALRGRRYRVVVDGAGVAAERGHWRETGNLVFHLSLVVVLAAVAAGSLWGYRADVLLTQGRGFANSVIQYDSLESGALFDPSDLVPFSLRLDRFTLRFLQSGPQQGAPDAFVADVTVRDSPGAPARPARIQVNDPLDIDGTLVHALNPGYAAKITVRGPDGTVAFSDVVPFLPQDRDYTSTGVVKVPRVGADIAVQGLLLPTAVVDAARGPHSVAPDPLDPALFFTAFRGDLGLDSGQPQSVFRLDTTHLRQLQKDGKPFAAAVGLGQSVDLPGGGSVRFDALSTWVNLQVSHPVGTGWALGGIIAAIVGLTLSMFVRRRRVWVRALIGPGGTTVVDVAGLDRSPGGDLGSELESLLAEVTGPEQAVPRAAARSSEDA